MQHACSTHVHDGVAPPVLRAQRCHLRRHVGARARLVAAGVLVVCADTAGVHMNTQAVLVCRHSNTGRRASQGVLRLGRWGRAHACAWCACCCTHAAAARVQAAACWWPPAARTLRQHRAQPARRPLGHQFLLIVAGGLWRALPDLHLAREADHLARPSRRGWRGHVLLWPPAATRTLSPELLFLQNSSSSHRSSVCTVTSSQQGCPQPASMPGPTAPSFLEAVLSWVARTPPCCCVCLHAWSLQHALCPHPGSIPACTHPHAHARAKPGTCTRAHTQRRLAGGCGAP